MISLPAELLRDIDRMARAEHRSRSELVREAVRAYVATRAPQRSAADRKLMQRAAKRILNARLRLPKGETAVSIVRRMRDALPSGIVYE